MAEYPEEMLEGAELSHEYVFNHIFSKLADTLEKYRDILPPIDDLEQEICRNVKGDAFDVTLGVIMLLKSRSEESNLIAEIHANVSIDFWHGLNPKRYDKHHGKYYIDSVVD